MFHIEANTAVPAQNVEADLVPIPSSQIAIFNAHWFPQDPPQLIFAAAMSPNIVRARVQTPTLNLITTPFIRGIMGGLVPTSPAQVDNLVMQPLQLRAREEIIMFGVQSNAGAMRITTIIGLLFGPNPPAQGTIYTMRGTSTTAAVANAWTLLTMVWQNQLPQGNYAAVGMQHQSANAQAARIIFLGQYYRPGCVSQAALVDYAHPIFRMGYMGQWGTWRDNIMPNIEVLCNAADAVHEVYLDFMQL